MPDLGFLAFSTANRGAGFKEGDDAIMIHTTEVVAPVLSVVMHGWAGHQISLTRKGSFVVSGLLNQFSSAMYSLTIVRMSRLKPNITPA